MGKKATRRKVIRRKSTPEELAELQRLWEQEETPEAMAANRQAGREALARSKQTVEARRVLDALARLREEKQVSLSTIQDRTGIAQSNLSRLFNEPEPNATIDTLQRIAAALGMQIQLELVTAGGARNRKRSMK